MSVQYRSHGVPEGPVFISYRHSDGGEKAEVLATLLRTGGLMPWFDGSDLAGGLVAHNVHGAIEEGISAAVLLITPEIGGSNFIKEEELPHLIALDTQAARKAEESRPLGAHQPRDFTLYVLSALGDLVKVDSDEADRLLQTSAPENAERLAGELLRTRLQYSQHEVDRLITDLLRRRLDARHRDLADRHVNVWVQTRPAPYVGRFARLPFIGSTVDLSVRLRQDPESGIPRELDYRCFQTTLPLLADAIYASVTMDRAEAAENRTRPKVTLAGGGHPSIYWALGSALPEARHAYGTVEVEDIRMSGGETEHDVWRECVKPTGDPQFHVVERSPLTAPDHRTDTNQLVVFLAGTRSFSSAAVEALRDQLPRCREARILQVAPVSGERSTAFFPTVEGYGLAQQFAEQLRSLHLDHKFELHIATSLPVGLVALIARQCNRVPVTFYELADTTDGVEYRAVIRTSPGSPNGPITKVFAHHPSTAPSDVTTLINLTPHDVTLFDAPHRTPQPLNSALPGWRRWLNALTTRLRLGRTASGGKALQSWPAPETIEGRDFWVRRDDERRLAGQMALGGGITAQLWDFSPGPLTNVPSVLPDTGYIVPRISAETAKRSDFFFPDGEVRDPAGRIIGCRAFGRFPSTDAERLFRTLVPRPPR